jgi:APA family basic amino acid/polyamine antiporter
MMLFLPPLTWLRLLGWLLLGLAIYFGYGMWHSKIGRQVRGRTPSLGGALVSASRTVPAKAE